MASITLFMFGESLAAGHTPTGGVAHYADFALEGYAFESPVPSWMRTGFNAAALNDWLISHDNRAPKWTNNPNSVNHIRYIFRNDTGDVDECDPTVAWIGCTWYDGFGQWGATEYVNETKLIHGWCEHSSVVGCFEVERVGLHELGHVSGLVRSDDGFVHPTVGESFTVMRQITPAKSTYGWTSGQLKVCDLLGFQLIYGIDFYTSSYADCADHLAGGVSNGKITTVVTQSGSTAFVCSGTPVTFSGTAKLSSDSHLAQIAGNPLQGRTISLRRDGITVDSDTVSSGGAWSTSYTGPNGTFTFDGRFAGETALDSDASSGRTVTWSSGC